MPDAQTIALIRDMKLQLSQKIGWYPSKNSLAHFTIFEFFQNQSNEAQLFKILEKIATHIQPLLMKCQSFDSFENGAFYVKPTEDSSQKMTEEMRYILQQTQHIKKSITNTTPHLTIGRRLNKEQLLQAQQLFQYIDVVFLITHLTLRKFNEEKKQFDVYQHFPLLGNPKEIQGILF